MTTRRKAVKAAASVPDDEQVGRFWMVYGIGQGAPRYQHPSMEAAADEAVRLANLSPGTRFVVLQAVDAYCAKVSPPKQFKIVTVDPPARVHDADIPF